MVIHGRRAAPSAKGPNPMANETTTDGTGSVKQAVGPYGIWSAGLRSEDPARRGELAEAAAELQELGFGAVWLGGSSAVRHAVPLIEATSRLVVATGIQTIWQYEAAGTAEDF